MKRIRPTFVWIHRWIGLAMAVFLIIEGVTGSLLAFRGELTAFLDPGIVGKAPYAGAPRLSMATLIERAQAAEPRAHLRWLQPFTDDTAVFLMLAKVDDTSGKPIDLPLPYLALDPWTGRVLKRMDEHMYSEGILPNVMPFTYELHKTLYLGEAGIWILSILALLWTIDCFAGVVLTLPLVLARFWQRWKPAWLIKWQGGAYRVNLDLHRANGLWLWPILFVLAWSSVTLAPKTGVYDFVMDGLFGPPAMDMSPFEPRGRPPTWTPKLDWQAAQARGDALLADIGRSAGYKALGVQALGYNAEGHTYWYRGHTDRFFPQDKLQSIYFDADTGALVSQEGTYDGNTAMVLTNWIVNLHMINDPVDYVAYRWFILLVGIIIAVLSGTGVYLWWKKRAARTVRA